MTPSFTEFANKLNLRNRATSNIKREELNKLQLNTNFCIRDRNFTLKVEFQNST